MRSEIQRHVATRMRFLPTSALTVAAISAAFLVLALPLSGQTAAKSGTPKGTIAVMDHALCINIFARWATAAEEELPEKKCRVTTNRDFEPFHIFLPRLR